MTKIQKKIKSVSKNSSDIKHFSKRDVNLTNKSPDFDGLFKKFQKNVKGDKNSNKKPACHIKNLSTAKETKPRKNASSKKVPVKLIRHNRPMTMAGISNDLVEYIDDLRNIEKVDCQEIINNINRNRKALSLNYISTSNKALLMQDKNTPRREETNLGDKVVNNSPNQSIKNLSSLQIVHRTLNQNRLKEQNSNHSLKEKNNSFNKNNEKNLEKDMLEDYNVENVSKKINFYEFNCSSNKALNELAKDHNKNAKKHPENKDELTKNVSVPVNTQNHSQYDEKLVNAEHENL